MAQGFVVGIGIGMCVLALLARGVMGLAMEYGGDNDPVSRFFAWVFCLPLIIIGLITLVLVLLSVL